MTGQASLLAPLIGVVMAQIASSRQRPLTSVRGRLLEPPLERLRAESGGRRLGERGKGRDEARDVIGVAPESARVTEHDPHVFLGPSEDREVGDVLGHQHPLINGGEGQELAVPETR